MPLKLNLLQTKEETNERSQAAGKLSYKGNKEEK
jgi:hypothetical protein